MKTFLIPSFVPSETPATVSIPLGSEIVSVYAQKGVILLCCISDTDEELREDRVFEAYSVGDVFDNVSRNFIGIVHACPKTYLVFERI